MNIAKSNGVGRNRQLSLEVNSPLCSVNMLEPSMRGSFGTRGLLRAERMDAPLAVPRSFACCAPMAALAARRCPRSAALLLDALIQ